MPAAAQEPEATTREAAIEQEQAEKVQTLHPYVPSKGEALVNKAEDILVNGVPRWHPFFESAYSGGGFTLGAGLRASRQPVQPARCARQLHDPGLQARRSGVHRPAPVPPPRLVVGARRLARGDTSGLLRHRDGHVDRRPHELRFSTAVRVGHADVLADAPPADAARRRRAVPVVAASPARGASHRSRRVYTPETLPGLGTKTTYLHTQGTVGFDWRTSPGYSRRGGFYGVTLHDYTDQDEEFGFRQVDYEAIQHFPILREAWVISLRGLAQTTYSKSDQQIPFFMLPYVGGGSTLRGFTSHRFRDQNSLLASGGVAHHGQPLHRHGGLLRRRQSRRARGGSRFQRAEERLRLRRAFPRTVRHAAAHRSGEEPRRSARSSSRRPRYSEAACHVAHHRSRHVPAAPALPDSVWSPRSACSPAPSRPRVRTSTRTIRSPASRSRRTRRRRSPTRSGRCTK